MKILFALALGVAILVLAQGGKTMHAAGSFDVKISPLAEQAGVPQRLSLDKQDHGALEATAKGEMLAAGNQKAGSAGYVALETVTGTLDGRTGSFSLMQLGTMSAGKLAMRVEIVPGSGTGALSGIEGTMKIEFGPKGEHFYALDYTLPEIH